MFSSFSICIIVNLMLISNNVFCQSIKDTFEEELFIKPLPNGYFNSQFYFTTRKAKDVTMDQQMHYRLFPKSLGEILEKYKVDELHLSLTQGHWRHQLWGYPVIDAPAGVQLWAWFHQSAIDIDKNWFGLVNALSGLFCASLNFIDKLNTVSPRFSFRPNGATSFPKVSNSSFIRYASLPREIVCTENLTPWKKLLPCGTKAGLAVLLNARPLFDVHYHSMSVHFRHTCQKEDCSNPSWELGQSLSIVSEQLPKKNGRHNDWSLRKAFASSISDSCELADASIVSVDLSNNHTGNNFYLTPPSAHQLKNGRNLPLAIYNIKELNISRFQPFNLAVTYSNAVQYSLMPTPVLYANRYIKGTGRGSGVIHCQIYYSKINSPLKIIYLEEIPHYARVFAHSLKIISNGQQFHPDHLFINERNNIEESFLLEAVITLPPNSLTTITMDFERSFLKFSAYPPDANHGFYIGSAVISTYLETSRNYTSPLPYQSGIHPELHLLSKKYFLRLHTEILLLVLPTPDFSMPYNVICLVCTVVALAFGPLHNITTKKLIAENPKIKKTWMVSVKSILSFKKIRSTSK